jgi:ribosomal protein S6
MSQETKNTETKLYELGFNIIPTLTEGDLDTQVSNIKKALTDNGSEIIKEGEVRLIDLKYTMVKHIAGSNKKFGQAYFGWVKFETTGEAVENIKKAVDGMDSILRYLLIKTVNDDAHSTSKIELEKGEVGISEAEGNDSAEEIEEGVDLGEEVLEENKPKVDEEKEVDEAIDELVK